MHTLNIELNQLRNFYKVTCPEGNYITGFTEDKSPKDYYGCKEMYVPLIFTEEIIREKYHCVTEEEHIEYEKAKEEAFKKEEEENLKKLKEFKPSEENKIEK